MRSTRDIKELVKSNRLTETSAILQRKQEDMSTAINSQIKGSNYTQSAEVPTRTGMSFKERTQSLINETNLKNLKFASAHHS